MEDEDRHELEDVNLQLVSVDKQATRESHEGDPSTAEPSPVPPAGFSTGDEMSEVSIWCGGPPTACTVDGPKENVLYSSTHDVQQYRSIV